MRPNWFLALPAPAGAWFEERVAATAPPEVRVVHPDDLHLTVAFLGGVEEAAAMRAWERRELWRAGPCTVSLAEVVGMGPPRRFSALSALLAEGRAEVEAAIGGCREALLAAAGAPPDPRPPLAHLTVARLARGASAAARARASAWAASLDLRDVRLEAGELALYVRTSAPGAPRFRVVARQPLA